MIDFAKWMDTLETPRGSRIAWIVLGLLCAVLFGSNLSGIGIWEPWEANEIMVAQEYRTRPEAGPLVDPAAPSYNVVVPTSDSKPVGRSLLKVWLLSAFLPDLSEGPQLGTMEFRARFPFALALWLLVMAQFAWMKRRVSVRAGLISGLVFATFPVIFIAAHNLATEVLFIVTTSLAFMSWFEVIHDENNRKRWLIVFTGALGLVFLDQRLFGVLLVLTVLAIHALSELIIESWKGQKDVDFKPAQQAALVIPVCLALFWWASRGAHESTMFVPHRAQLVAVAVPLLTIVGLFWAGRHSHPGRVFWREGLIACGAVTLLAVGIGYFYADANPTLLKDGEVFGKIPVLSFFLENHIFGRSLVVKHMTFDLWVRQIGFAVVPWVGLVPAGLAYLGRATRQDRDDLLEPGVSVRRFILVWAVFVGVFLVFGSVYNHYFYPGYLALALGVGLMFADDDFWAELKTKPLALYALGFFAVAAVMMVGKDLERFPARFVEVYSVLQEKLELKEDFSFGRTMKVLKYAMMGVLILYFFGIVSWLGLMLKNLPKALELLKQGPRGWWSALSNGVRNLSAESTSQSDRPFEARALEKDAYRTQKGLLPMLARLFETPAGFVPVLLTVTLVTALVYQALFVPELTNHMSQRGVFETFQNSAQDQGELYRYEISKSENSVYLQDLPSVQNAVDFRQRFEQDQRFFAVIPRDALARINQEIRRESKRNLHVLDARSSRLLLVSNQLLPGEKDHNFVAEHIFQDDSTVQQKLAFDDGQGGKVPPQFDGQLEMIGISFDKPADKDGVPSYKWGETAVFDYYFRVLNRVPGNQKIFLHADIAGNRISGDHFPNNGDFPTNQWLPGDIVRSRHHLVIENYATPGIYNLNFGFFVGGNRMKVTPAKAHDGQNRVRVGRIKVTSL